MPDAGKRTPRAGKRVSRCVPSPHKWRMKYVLHDIDWKRCGCSVRKMAPGPSGDHDVELAGYVIDNGTCSCPGWHFALDCRHVQMLRGLPPGIPAELAVAEVLAGQILRSMLADDMPYRVGRIVGDVRRRRAEVRAIHIVLRINDTVTEEKRTVGWLTGQSGAEGLPVVIDARKDMGVG